MEEEKEAIKQEIKRLIHRHPSQLEDTRTFGEKAADRVSDFVGSWKFIFIYVVITALWVTVNILNISGFVHFDPYPFIFYTFSVSVLAILLSSLILLAGNRQAQIDRKHAENSYEHIDAILEINNEQMKILQKQEFDIIIAMLEKMNKI